MGARGSCDERVRGAQETSVLAQALVVGCRWPRAGVAFALLLLACQAAPTTPVPPDDAGACENLAYVFLLIALERDRGSTKEAQIEMARESVESPFVSRPEHTLRHLLHVIDLVYRYPDSSAREIEAIVLEGCVVDDQGRAVVNTAWPTR
jgi:hypothetical protein